MKNLNFNLVIILTASIVICSFAVSSANIPYIVLLPKKYYDPNAD